MSCPQIAQIYADWFIPNEIEGSPETVLLPSWFKF